MRQDTRKKLMEKTTGQFLYFGLPIVPQEQLNLLIINDNTSNQAWVQQKNVCLTLDYLMCVFAM